MKRILLTLMCLLAFSVSAFAAETGERVLTLPADMGAWYLTVFGEANDVKYQELNSWLKTNKGLANLKSQVRFNKYTTDQLRYQRYVKNMPGLPCIRLQNEKGLVVSEFWATNIPTTSAELYRGIKGDLQDKTSWGCLRRRRCPQPVEPLPAPLPIPVPEPDEPIGPPVLDEEPEPEPEADGLPWLLMLISATLGGGFGFVQGYKSEQMDKSSPTSSKL